MKKLAFTIFLISALTSCFNKKSDTSTPDKSQIYQGISPEDFINKLKIKIEVFNSGSSGSYISGALQDQQKWTIDSADNFEGTWISESKTLGNWAFNYKFSLLEDGRLRVALETFKTKQEHGVTVLGKYVGGPTFIFKHTRPLSIPLVMFNKSLKSPSVSFTPILSKD